ncbi:MAG TPA: pyridoxal 5'-phosphate synthase [Solirubrobacterales bacterium]|nr:pyridoxal 5'-phosphate synthase [Solirubrobacterales bacterium]
MFVKNQVLDPLCELGRWLKEAHEAEITDPATCTFATVDREGRPTARTVKMKRVADDALLFTSALWTRKVRDIKANPHVAIVFHWPELGRQIQIVGTVTFGSRELAAELYADRDVLHQLQTVVSRQGKPIGSEELETMRDRLAHLAEVQETPPRCPEDWGALLVTPEAIELWSESADRIHERRLFTRPDGHWTLQLLSP